MSEGNIEYTHGIIVGKGGNAEATITDKCTIGAKDHSGAVSTLAGLAIRSEAAIIAETDETKLSHKLPVTINGSEYFIMLTAT
jgi:hypothetical protein